MKYILFSFFAIILIVLSLDLLLKQPFIWPDEAIWGDIALNIIQEGRLGTDLWKGIFPGIEEHALWFPSLFFYTIAGWFKAFGFSIQSQRLLSSLFGLLALAVIFFLTKTFSFDKKSATGAAFFIILATFLDYTFFLGSKVSRPEIFILFYGLTSLLLLKLSQDEERGGVRKLIITLSGFCVGLSMLHHVLAISFLLIGLICLTLMKGKKVLKNLEVYLYILSAVIPVIIWLFLIRDYIPILIEQTNHVYSRKNRDETWFLAVLTGHSINLQLTFFVYLLSSIYLFGYSYIKKESRLLIVVTSLAILWFFNFYGRLGWYLIYIVPFIYLGLGILIFQKKVNMFALFLAGILIFLNLCNLVFGVPSISYEDLQKTLGDNANYNIYCSELLKKIPDQKSVYLIAIPDPYYCFKEANRENKLMEFPVGVTKEGVKPYKANLDSMDYVIFTAFYDAIPFGNFLPEYLRENTLTMERTEGENQYHAYIIKLKPKNERK